MSNLPVLWSAVRDLLGTLWGIPTGAANALVESYRARKQEDYRRVLLEELRQGTTSPLHAASDDEMVALTADIVQSMEAGIARRNLRYLIRLLRGLSGQRPIYAADFQRFQKIVADLSREEMILLATLHSEVKIERAKNPNYTMPEPWNRAETKLVPSIFSTSAEMRATAFALLRTGLLMTREDADSIAYPAPTPLLDEVVRLASFEDLVSEDTD
ncbi:MAG TPA: hypothetical protein VIF14_08725 [Alphaproteobacteria bacterium]